MGLGNDCTCSVRVNARETGLTGSGVKPWGNPIPGIFQLFNPSVGLHLGVKGSCLDAQSFSSNSSLPGVL